MLQPISLKNLQIHPVFHAPAIEQLSGSITKAEERSYPTLKVLKAPVHDWIKGIDTRERQKYLVFFIVGLKIKHVFDFKSWLTLAA